MDWLEKRLKQKNSAKDKHEKRKQMFRQMVESQATQNPPDDKANEEKNANSDDEQNLLTNLMGGQDGK